jgi:uncharacterized protein (TIGR03083 family)
MRIRGRSSEGGRDNVGVTIPTDPPCDYSQLFRVERARLLDMLRSLSAEDWQRATPCPGWDVLGLVNHLVGDDLGVIAWQRDHHHGAPAPDAADEATFIDWLDDLQMEWVRAARRISPRLAIELLDWLGEPVADTFAGQDPRSCTARVSWASDSPVPIWLDQARELTERWIHRQQLHDAVGRPTDLDADLAGPVLDALRWAYPYRLGAADVPDSRVDIEIAEPFRRTWLLTNRDGEWVFIDQADAPAAAALSMTAEHAWRLLTNNYDAEAHGPLRTSGDPALIDVLLRTRAIIGAPKMR